MTNMLPALTGSNVIYGMGMMEMGMTMSYEQLLTDEKNSAGNSCKPGYNGA